MNHEQKIERQRLLDQIRAKVEERYYTLVSRSVGPNSQLLRVNYHRSEDRAGFGDLVTVTASAGCGTRTKTFAVEIDAGEELNNRWATWIGRHIGYDVLSWLCQMHLASMERTRREFFDA